jgi:hypothetical protein
MGLHASDRSAWSSQKGCAQKDLVEPSGYWPEVPLSGTLVQKLSYFHLSAASLAFAPLVGVEARSAELEGALQYPPPSVGEDVQPPPAG